MLSHGILQCVESSGGILGQEDYRSMIIEMQDKSKGKIRVDERTFLSDHFWDDANKITLILAKMYK